MTELSSVSRTYPVAVQSNRDQNSGRARLTISRPTVHEELPAEQVPAYPLSMPTHIVQVQGNSPVYIGSTCLPVLYSAPAFFPMQFPFPNQGQVIGSTLAAAANGNSTTNQGQGNLVRPGTGNGASLNGGGNSPLAQLEKGATTLPLRGWRKQLSQDILRIFNFIGGGILLGLCTCELILMLAELVAKLSSSSWLSDET